MKIRGAAGRLRMKTQGGKLSRKGQQQGEKQSFHEGKGF
jgi:hypothetical protein